MAIATVEDEGTTFVLGGARSGKSQFAEGLVTARPRPWLYIATAEAHDDEMAARIAAHQARRGADWQTIHAPLALPEAVEEAPHGASVLVDCLTLWLSNVMHAEIDIEKLTERLEEALHARVGTTVLVSNEVGFGIVPETELGRAFRDAQGRLNQRMATLAGRVVLMVAGQPLIVKGSS